MTIRGTAENPFSKTFQIIKFVVNLDWFCSFYLFSGSL